MCWNRYIHDKLSHHDSWGTGWLKRIVIYFKTTDLSHPLPWCCTFSCRIAPPVRIWRSILCKHRPSSHTTQKSRHYILILIYPYTGYVMGSTLNNAYNTYTSLQAYFVRVNVQLKWVIGDILLLSPTTQPNPHSANLLNPIIRMIIHTIHAFCDLLWLLAVGRHYGDVKMGMIASQITSLTIVYSTVYSDAVQRKHQCSASLAFVWGIHPWPVNSPHKWPVTRKMFPFDGVIMATDCACALASEATLKIWLMNDRNPLRTRTSFY